MNRKFTNEETGAICASLAYLIHAGIPLSDALSLVAEDENDSFRAEELKKMAEKADMGEYLSDVFRGSGCFEDYVCEMLSTGEKTGRVEEALSSLADSCEKRASLDRQLKSALVYPSILLLVMLAVITVLLIFVLPVFDEVYSQLGSGLTGVAGGLLNVGKALGSVSPVIIVLFIAAALFLAAFSSIKEFRDKVLNLFWKSGKDKGVAAKISLARFAQGMSMCMSSGLSPEESIAAASSLPGSDTSVAEKVRACNELLDSGESLAPALRDSGLLPPSESRMLEAGIRGGSGDAAMEQIARRLTEESEAAITDSVSGIEPAMVIITSVLVGLILLSVMLPLINIMAAIG